MTLLLAARVLADAGEAIRPGTQNNSSNKLVMSAIDLRVRLPVTRTIYDTSAYKDGRCRGRFHQWLPATTRSWQSGGDRVRRSRIKAPPGDHRFRWRRSRCRSCHV